MSRILPGIIVLAVILTGGLYWYKNIYKVRQKFTTTSQNPTITEPREGAHSFLMNGSTLYALDAYGRLYIFDASNPIAPVAKKMIDTQRNGMPRLLGISPTRLYIGDVDKLVVYRLNQDGAPEVIKENPLEIVTDGPLGTIGANVNNDVHNFGYAAIGNGYVVAASFGQIGIYREQPADTYTRSTQISYSALGDLGNLQLIDNRLYAIYESPGNGNSSSLTLIIYDLSNPDQPTELGRWVKEISGGQFAPNGYFPLGRVLVDQSRAYIIYESVFNNQSKLWIETLGIADPGAPLSIGSIEVPIAKSDQWDNALAQDNKLFLAYNTGARTPEDTTPTTSGVLVWDTAPGKPPVFTRDINLMSLGGADRLLYKQGTLYVGHVIRGFTPISI